MSDCSHEEADTRMLVHLRAALENGLTSFLVRTVDTDVIIILLGKYHGIKQVCSHLNLWVRFGVGKAVKNIHINATFEHLGAKVLGQFIMHEFFLASSGLYQLSGPRILKI